MRNDLELYGYYVFTHAWRRVLVVMSAAGAAAVRTAIGARDDVNITDGPDQLVQFHEKRAGALERIAAAHDIRILSKAEWDERKTRLGDGINR